jgi:hypothetical protein
MFITQIWAKGGRELAGNEAQNMLNKVQLFASILLFYIRSYHVPHHPYLRHFLG